MSEVEIPDDGPVEENQNLEWKSSWRDEHLKWICGFANAQGGRLVIGKNDRGEVLGVKDPLRLMEEIPNKAQSLLGVVVDVNLMSAVLLFHPVPARFFAGAFVKIGYFRTETELAYQDVIEGNLFAQVDRTVDLLRTKYSKAEITYEDIYRRETPPAPGEALREAV